MPCSLGQTARADRRQDRDGIDRQRPGARIQRPGPRTEQCRWRKRQASGTDDRSSLPIPFHATSRTTWASRRSRPTAMPCRIGPPGAAPGIRIASAIVGAIWSSWAPGAIFACPSTPVPENTIGTWVGRGRTDGRPRHRRRLVLSSPRPPHDGRIARHAEDVGRAPRAEAGCDLRLHVRRERTERHLRGARVPRRPRNCSHAHDSRSTPRGRRPAPPGPRSPRPVLVRARSSPVSPNMVLVRRPSAREIDVPSSPLTNTRRRSGPRYRARTDLAWVAVFGLRVVT